MMRIRMATLLACVALSVAIMPATLCRGQDRAVKVEATDSAQPGGKSMAILIGVQDYASVRELMYARADVELLAETLRDVCKFDKVILMTEDAAEKMYRPTLGNISARLRQWLTVANSSGYQRVLLYFSGHGFKDKKGRHYFAPADCDRQNLELTGVPHSYVKQRLDGCTRVSVKLLVLDCCYAGAGRGDGVGESGEATAAVYKNAKGLLTLASCSADEVSLESDRLQHGLFTYWLCEGLKGSANENRDGFVDSDELKKYVYNHVLESAAGMGRQQNVVFRPSDDWRGVALIAPVVHRPEPLTEPTSVTAVFTVREEDADGPLVEGAEVELWYRSKAGERGKKLASGVSRTGGKAELEVNVNPAQSLRGDFLALVSRGGGSNTWRLPRFPQSRNWVLYAPAESETAKEITNSIGMKLMLIEPGEFMMGSPDSDEDAFDKEHPQHSVKITKPFYLGVTEVTQEQYERVMGKNPSDFTGDPQRPVETVSWEEAVEFCQRLSKKEGKTYRLPTEAEWEYACRAGSTTKWCFGDSEPQLGEYAWYFDNSSDTTHPVSEKKPNAWGLYDMHGNVWEWCDDWYEDYYSASPATDPKGPGSTDDRVLRGGSWYGNPGFSRSAVRLRHTPDVRFHYLGFRLARTP